MTRRKFLPAVYNTFSLENECNAFHMCRSHYTQLALLSSSQLFSVVLSCSLRFFYWRAGGCTQPYKNFMQIEILVMSYLP